MPRNIVITRSPEETQDLSKKVLTALPPRNVLALYGELGSGKTTFVQGLAKHLGIKKRILSPTFVLMRQYQITNNSSHNSMSHLDLYRLSKAADLKTVDLEELAKNPRNLVVIEWAEKAKNILPIPHLKLHFRVLDEYTREITVKGDN